MYVIFWERSTEVSLPPEKCAYFWLQEGLTEEGVVKIGGRGYAEFNAPSCFNWLSFHFMIELIQKFVNAVGKSEKAGRDTNVMKSYVQLKFVTRCRLRTKQESGLKFSNESECRVMLQQWDKRKWRPIHKPAKRYRPIVHIFKPIVMQTPADSKIIVCTIKAFYIKYFMNVLIPECHVVLLVNQFTPL